MSYRKGYRGSIHIYDKMPKWARDLMKEYPVDPYFIRELIERGLSPAIIKRVIAQMSRRTRACPKW